MINLIDIVYTIPVLVSLLLAYRNIILRRQRTRLVSELLQAEADKDLLKKQILQTMEDKKLVESEEFMMFLNSSREAAFTYIEEVQSEIAKFDGAIYDAISGETDSATTIKRILDANNKLQKLLPDNIKTNNVQGEL